MCILSSLKRLMAFIVLIIILAVGTLTVFELLIGPTNLPNILQKLGDIIIIFAFSLTTIAILQRIKGLMTPRIGVQLATILQYFFVGIALLVTTFAILGLFEVNISTLLTSAGIISLTAGLIVSTFVGGILSGALIFTTYRFKIGEDVMVNNVPGKVTDITALVMRIRTDTGQITIPNSAIAAGGVLITAVLPPDATQETRLHYKKGDRVITSYGNEEGTVKELTAYHTTILLDSGKELTFLNNSVLTGGVTIAKITVENRTKR